MFDCTIAYGLKFLIPQLDRAVGDCLRKAGEFARAEVEFIVDSLSQTENPLFLDVGANIGAISLPVAGKLPSVNIVAFEPNLPVYGLLNANVVGNQLENVICYPWAVGKDKGVVDFPFVPLGASLNFGGVGFSTDGFARCPTVMVRLDDLDLRKIDFLKIDVEGFDLDVLSGARKLLDRDKPTLIFEGKVGENTTKAIELVQDLGFDCYWFYTPFLLPTNMKRFPVDMKNWIGDMNVVAVPAHSRPAWPLPKINSPDEDWRGRRDLVGHLAPLLKTAP